MSDQPITQWIREARGSNTVAEHGLWDHYFDRVVRLARSRMFSVQASVYDEEDTAVSAMNSLFRGIRKQRFPDLQDRHNLWRILIVITNRKLRAQWRRQSTKGRPKGEDCVNLNLNEILCEEPTPVFVAEMMEETEKLLDSLQDDRLRRIAVMRMDGFSNDEIAERLGCTSRTVLRKLERIRDLWGVDDDL